MVFVIHLLSAEQQPPVFQMAAPSLEVSQGGKATIGEWGARAGRRALPEARRLVLAWARGPSRGGFGSPSPLSVSAGWLGQGEHPQGPAAPLLASWAALQSLNCWLTV